MAGRRLNEEHNFTRCVVRRKALRQISAELLMMASPPALTRLLPGLRGKLLCQECAEFSLGVP